MSKNCPLCGFANAESASKCENCQSFLRPSPRRAEQTAVSTSSVFTGSRLVILIVVLVAAVFAVYKMFDNSSVAKTPVSDVSASNTALVNLSQQADEIESNQAAQKRVQQAEAYRQKRERKKAASETPTDIFGSPQPSGCETYTQANGTTIQKGNCF